MRLHFYGLGKDDRKHGVRIHLKVLLCCGKLEMLVLLHNRTDVLCSSGYGFRPQISTVEDQAQIFCRVSEVSRKNKKGGCYHPR
jgi:hypothetical protein